MLISFAKITTSNRECSVRNRTFAGRFRRRRVVLHHAVHMERKTTVTGPIFHCAKKRRAANGLFFIVVSIASYLSPVPAVARSFMKRIIKFVKAKPPSMLSEVSFFDNCSSLSSDAVLQLTVRHNIN